MKKKTVLLLAVILLSSSSSFAEIYVNGILSVDYYDYERDANEDASGAQTSQGSPKTFDVSSLALIISAEATPQLEVRTDILFDGFGNLVTEALSTTDPTQATEKQTHLSVLQAYARVKKPFGMPVNIKFGKFYAVFGVEPYPIGIYNHEPITSSLVKTYTSIGDLTGIEASTAWKWIDLTLYMANGISPRINSFTGDDFARSGGTTLTGEDIDLNDNDNDYAVGGRLGVMPDFLEGFSAGISYVRSAVNPNRQYIMRDKNSPPGGVRFIPGVGRLPLVDASEIISMFDIDAVYGYGPFEFRGEYVEGKVVNRQRYRLNYKGYTLQAVFDITDQFSAIARYDWYDQEDDKTPKEDRESWTYGFNYLISPGALLKVELRENNEGEGLSNYRLNSRTGRNIGLGTVNSSVRTRNGGGEDINNQLGASMIILF